ncbi:MAG: hypothetical protein AAGU77_09945 [Bacillota bacterium]
MKPQFLISRAAALLLCAALLLLSGCAAQASNPAPSPAVSASPAPAATVATDSPSPMPQAAASPSPASDEAAVEALVQAFGKTLQTVSLLDEAGVASAMEAAYGQYVTPELLKAWQAKPAQAPGRMVSSPWPDHIDVFSVQKESDTTYTVTGQIAEITSDSPTAAARRAITLTVEKQPDGAFLISAVTLGNYAEKDPVVYENSEYGFDFYLPSDWEGYTVLDETWEGTPIDGGAKQTGPEIILRSPQWTEEKPYQDIPILVFTQEQWAQVAAENLSVSAAPIPPTVLGVNAEYVFALPARYNFAYPAGYEEVEEIIVSQPLWPVG